ncbi:MAG TPA: serine hydrolase [Gaiellaceae bacterium]|nr:serine hydrolase [Gaiellaceae bacterium]
MQATRLLWLIWRDEAAPAEAFLEVRARMAQQLTRHRIARGLPPDATFAGKTGTFARRDPQRNRDRRAS